MNMMLEGFLLGAFVTASMTAALYFFRFWRQTRDALFLAFALSFLIEGVNRMGFLLVEAPNEGTAAIYVVRLLSYLLIFAAIVRKNLN